MSKPEIVNLQQKVNVYQSKLVKVNDKYTNIVEKYLDSKRESKSVKKVNTNLQVEIKVLEKEESELRSSLNEQSDIIKEYQPYKVKKQLDSKETKIISLSETVESYKQDLSEERKEWVG